MVNHSILVSGKFYSRGRAEARWSRPSPADFHGIAVDQSPDCAMRFCQGKFASCEVFTKEVENGTAFTVGFPGLIVWHVAYFSHNAAWIRFNSDKWDSAVRKNLVNMFRSDGRFYRWTRSGAGRNSLLWLKFRNSLWNDNYEERVLMHKLVCMYVWRSKLKSSKGKPTERTARAEKY